MTISLYNYTDEETRVLEQKIRCFGLREYKVFGLGSYKDEYKITKCLIVSRFTTRQYLRYYTVIQVPNYVKFRSIFSIFYE